AQQVVGSRNVLFGVVDDQVPVTAQQVTAELRQRQQVVPKNLDLERPVEHILFQAGAAKGQGHHLDLVVDAQPGRVAAPGAPEPGRYAVDRKADGGGLVQVVDDLASQAG